ncbi:hypothetical protein BDV32DRAFT_154900 [Aspergillus pseudonomiae]|nr:hypothetical protein BDV32DRAFT_154900 [Aspergillus pseudonomiae]
MKFITLIAMFLVGLVAPVAISLPFKNKNLPSRAGQSPPQISYRRLESVTTASASIQPSMDPAWSYRLDQTLDAATTSTVTRAHVPKASVSLLFSFASLDATSAPDVALVLMLRWTLLTLPTRGDLHCPGCAGFPLGEHVDPFFSSWRWRYGGHRAWSGVLGAKDFLDSVLRLAVLYLGRRL